jgi:hypothetical protein
VKAAPDAATIEALEGVIRARFDAGDTDEEIRNRIVLEAGPYRAKADHMRMVEAGLSEERIQDRLDLEWTLIPEAGTLNRYLRAIRLTALERRPVGQRTPTGEALLPTDAEVKAKRAELKVAGGAYGYQTLAKALHASKSTIRRRLGKL